jgi:hypothetical protein
MWPSYDSAGLFRAHMHPGSYGRGLDTVQVNGFKVISYLLKYTVVTVGRKMSSFRKQIVYIIIYGHVWSAATTVTQ